MQIVITDGGRSEALQSIQVSSDTSLTPERIKQRSLFQANASRKPIGDCVARAIAIASGLPYEQVWLALAEGHSKQRKSKRTAKQPFTADNGINVGRQWFKDYMRSIGFVHVPVMGIGTGCQVHLKDGELPKKRRLVVNLSKHFCAVVNGVIYDNHDPSRNGTRCVYSYYVFMNKIGGPNPC